MATKQNTAQVIRMGRGWAVTRNSAMLCTTDYEHIANEIANAINKAAAPELVEALRKISDEAESGLHTIDSDGIQTARYLLAKVQQS